MKIGDLKHRIELYSITSTVDGEGGQATPTYTLIESRYANVRQMSESEISRSGLNVGERTYKVTMRKYMSEVLSKAKQIRWGTKRLNISSVVGDEFWYTIIATDKE